MRVGGERLECIPYFEWPDFERSHMMSSPLRALVRILLLKTRGGGV